MELGQGVYNDQGKLKPLRELSLISRTVKK